MDHINDERKYAASREWMVDNQLIPLGISNQRVLAAFQKVPRHLFVPADRVDCAYDDSALAIGAGQTISQPYMVAVMTQLLELKGQEKVLEVGTGSGYQAAILAELCKQVITVERIKILSHQAEQILNSLSYSNIKFVVGDGTQGYPPEAPYDAMMVTAGAEEILPALIDQLAEGGRLVIPVGPSGFHRLTLVIKKQGKIEIKKSIECVFVPLITEPKMD